MNFFIFKKFKKVSFLIMQPKLLNVDIKLAISFILSNIKKFFINLKV